MSRSRVLASFLLTVALAPHARSQCERMFTAMESYAPPEVGVPHPRHLLTVFLPTVPPPPDTGLYPTLLYSPASMFSSAEAANLEDGFREFGPLLVIGEDPPNPGGGGGFVELHCTVTHPGPGSGASSASAVPLPPCDFLATALNAGWAVVTVGSTGWDSWPTCGQLNDCNECLNPAGSNPGCAPTGGCWDTNLWYPPGSPQWDDFDLFWGEKDFTWARQWVAENAGTYSIDNDRIVVCGTSTGSIYSAFLAYGPNRAWGGGFSTQAQRDTRVAGMVAFEPNTWVKALRTTWGGVHWGSSTSAAMLCGSTGVGCVFGSPAACYNRRATILDGGVGDVAPGLLESTSVSRWVRELEDASERPTPTFIASGDGFATTGFQRDANLAPFAADYDRHLSALLCGTGVGPGTLVSGDPLLAFTSGADELRLHDSWFAMNYMVDLAMLDDTLGRPFHEHRSRLFLLDGHDWDHLPPCLSKTASPPASAAEVLGLDGTYAGEGFGTQSIENTGLAPQVIAWMERELCVERTPGVACRNPVVAGPSATPNANFSNYATATSFTGVPTAVEIDLKQSPGYELAAVLIFTAPYAPGSELVLAGDQVILCDLGTLLFTTAFDVADGDGVVRFTLGAPAPASPPFYTQAVLVDAQALMPFALTNAQDLTVQ